MSQCTAKSKRTGERCGANAMKGSTKCYHHGGAQPKGIASPNYKHGRYSRYTSTRLQDKVERLISDPDLLNNYDEIRIITARIDEKLDRLDTIDNSAVMDAIKAQVANLRFAYKNESFAGLEKALDTLEDIVDQRVLHYATDEDIRKDMDTRRKLIETQRKLNADAEQMISAEQLMNVVSRLMQSIKDNVKDRKALEAIQQDFVMAFGIAQSQRIDAKAGD